MDIDSPLSESPKDNDNFAMLASPRRSISPHLTGEGSSSKVTLGSAFTSTVDKDGDNDMTGSPRSQKPPALPPRKAAEVSDSVMMFGKFHLAHTVVLAEERFRQAA
jgi:ubiquitin carboxyl-terminal hydrolase 25/28